MIQFLKRTAASVTAATANRVKFFFDENGAPAFRDEAGVLGNFISSASIDATPTNGSNNAVASNGAYDADEAVKAFAIQRSNHTGTQTASTISDFNTSAASAAPVASVFGRTGAVTAQSGDYTKSQVGLANVDNTSDLNKPISTATQTALNLKSDTTHGHTNATTSAAGFMSASDKTKLDGVAASATNTPLSSTTPAALGTAAVGTGTTAARSDHVHAMPNKSDVGLGNVDNTSDANKPVSTATQTALNLKYDASNPNGYETPTQLNTRDTNNRARANHTGTQLSSTISDFASGVLAVVLTGLSTATNAAISATDSVLAAMGKLQAQISARLVSANNLSDLASASTARTNLGLGTAATQNSTAFDAAGSSASAQAFSIQRANHTGTQLANTISNFNTAAIAAPVTGLSIADSTDVVSTDTLLAAIGKLQAQLNLVIDDPWTELITTADIIVNSNVTLTNVTELQFSAVAGNSYYLEYTILFRTAANNTGFTITIGTSNTAAGTLACQANLPIAADGTAALYTGSITALGDVVTSTGVAATQPTWFICNVKGLFDCTTSGTVLPQFRSEVNGSNVNFGANSVALIRTF
jgi:hypothetical protein